MPTGYTHDVQTGVVNDFPTFALQCARAFGALIEMRDEPTGAPIPEEFQPSDYHLRAIEKAAAELDRLRSMRFDEIQRAADQAHAEAVARWEEGQGKRADERRRYEAMLAKARAWTEPTPEHIGLRDFMISQLEESIRFDCDYEVPYPAPQSAERWYQDRVAAARRDVDYHIDEDRKERERVASRNRWVRQLRESLTPYKETR